MLCFAPDFGDYVNHCDGISFGWISPGKGPKIMYFYGILLFYVLKYVFASMDNLSALFFSGLRMFSPGEAYARCVVSRKCKQIL